MGAVVISEGIVYNRNMRYYSPVKEYETRKKRHPFYACFRGVVRIFFPKNKFVWMTEKPEADEAVFFVCNHTKIYAPTFFLTDKKQRARVWANCYFLYPDLCWHHFKNKVLKDREPKFLLYPLVWLLKPLIVAVFRAFEPIPVFHKDERVETMTFKKSIETMESGLKQVIFPERTLNKVNRYVYQFNHGFPRVAERYFRETGKIMKFYPVSCAQKLRTFAVGEPIAYDPEKPMDAQADEICDYLQNKIGELGDGLPPHKPVLYG